MKLLETGTPCGVRTVIMYNRDQTKAIYRPVSLYKIYGSLYMSQTRNMGHGEMLCDIIACWPHAEYGLWLWQVDPQHATVEQILSDAEKRNVDTQEHFIERIKRRTQAGQHIRLTEMEMISQIHPEMEQNVADARVVSQQKRDERVEERRKEVKERALAQAQKQNDISRKIVEKTFECLKNGGVAENKPITVYVSTARQEELTTILYLFRLYDIHLSSRSAWWVNNRLISVTVEDGICKSYAFTSPRASKGSTVFRANIDTLLEKIKTEEREFTDLTKPVPFSRNGEYIVD